MVLRCVFGIVTDEHVFQVKSRIMIDKGMLSVIVVLWRVLIPWSGNFRRLNPNYEMPMVKVDNAPPPNVPDQYGNYPPSPPPIPYNPSMFHRQVGGPFELIVWFADSTVPTFQVRARATRDVDELTEDELMLTPPSVYGFSLTDKTWRK